MSENPDRNLLGARVQVVVSTGKRWLVLENEVAYQLEQRYGSLGAFLERMHKGAYMETVGALFALCWEIEEREARALIVGPEFLNYFTAIGGPNGLIATFLGAKITVKEAPASGEGEPRADQPSHSPGIVSMASRSSRAGSTRSASGR